MKEKLLTFLCCPICYSDFSLENRVFDESSAEIISGTLSCTGCGEKFQIRDSIPRIIMGDVSRERINNAKAFGYEWKQFSTLKDKYEAQFLDWISPVKKEFFKDKIVLDAGCGKGRHSYLASKFGAREVISVDLSEAAEVAYNNTKSLGNVHVVQADIYRLPFKKCFDYIFSLGVLHHLPDPQKGLDILSKLVRDGGGITLWVYGSENNGWIKTLVDPVRINITSRMRYPVLRIFSLSLGFILYIAVNIVYRPVNMVSRQLGTLLFYNDYLYYISKFNHEEISSIVFDHLAAPVAHYTPGDEFKRWFESSGLKKIKIRWHNNNSWSGNAIKAG
jgi:SAM-dependent methyltransferase